MRDRCLQRCENVGRGFTEVWRVHLTGPGPALSQTKGEGDAEEGAEDEWEAGKAKEEAIEKEQARRRQQIGESRSRRRSSEVPSITTCNKSR